MINRSAVILLVEDDPLDVELTKAVLTAHKMANSIYVVDNGIDALDFLYKRGKYKAAPTPDIIFLDLNLPKMDGREVLIDLKHNEDLKSIPIVILTSSEIKKDIRLAYDNYASCYVTKPLDIDQFLNIVKTLNNFWLSIVTTTN
jgi:two-component system response regulator